jgi:hypothetical protein
MIELGVSACQRVAVEDVEAFGVGDHPQVAGRRAKAQAVGRWVDEAAAHRDDPALR